LNLVSITNLMTLIVFPTCNESPLLKRSPTRYYYILAFGCNNGNV
jgi:hypothetical protein